MAEATPVLWVSTSRQKALSSSSEMESALMRSTVRTVARNSRRLSRKCRSVPKYSMSVPQSLGYPRGWRMPLETRNAFAARLNRVDSVHIASALYVGAFATASRGSTCSSSGSSRSAPCAVEEACGSSSMTLAGLAPKRFMKTMKSDTVTSPARFVSSRFQKAFSFFSGTCAGSRASPCCASRTSSRKSAYLTLPEPCLSTKRNALYQLPEESRRRLSASLSSAATPSRASSSSSGHSATSSL
mmetsp:Transcript_81172/g.235452  ORF Transcript_81172/g.235452 Transcript_81172/m.235452 type:complete len:243 (-) Transcript_81172:631-1359(-)